MTCCAAAICAVVRHSVSSPLPVLGCSALPRHVMHAWALRAVTVHALPPQGCSSPRPLCSGVTNQVSAETRLPEYPIPIPSLCSRPRCSGLSCASRLRSGSSRAVAPLDKARAIARARTSWAKENLIFLFPDGGPSAPKVRYRPPLPSAAACAAAAGASCRSLTSQRGGGLSRSGAPWRSAPG